MEYPQLAKRFRMLEFLYRALDEARKRRDPGLMLEFYHATPDNPPRLMVYGTNVDIAQELGLGGAEAMGLLKDLDTYGYVYLDYGSGGPYVDAGDVIVSFTEKGHAAIKVLSNPNEALLAKLDAIAEAIRELGDMTLDEKKPVIDAVEELKRFVRALPPRAAAELLGRLPSILGLGDA